MKFSSQELKELASYFRKEIASQVLDANLNNPFLLDVIDIDLSAAGSREINFAFKTIWLKSGTDNTISIDFYPNRQDLGLKPVPMTLNDVLKFDRMLAQGKLQWAAQAGKTAKLVVATEIDFTSGALINSITGSVIAKNSVNSYISQAQDALAGSMTITVPTGTVFKGILSSIGAGTNGVGYIVEITKGGSRRGGFSGIAAGASGYFAGQYYTEWQAGTYVLNAINTGGCIAYTLMAEGVCYNV